MINAGVMMVASVGYPVVFHMVSCINTSPSRERKFQSAPMEVKRFWREGIEQEFFLPEAVEDGPAVSERYKAFIRQLRTSARKIRSVFFGQTTRRQELICQEIAETNFTEPRTLSKGDAILPSLRACS